MRQRQAAEATLSFQLTIYFWLRTGKDREGWDSHEGGLPRHCAASSHHQVRVVHERPRIDGMVGHGEIRQAERFNSVALLAVACEYYDTHARVVSQRLDDLIKKWTPEPMVGGVAGGRAGHYKGTAIALD